MIVPKIASDSRYCRGFGQDCTEGEMQRCLHDFFQQQIKETSVLEDLIHIYCGLSILIWKIHAMLDCTGIWGQKCYVIFYGKFQHPCLGQKKEGKISFNLTF